ncbi:MAG: septum formation family protein [Demequinaceae bacterium]|nr:septum formation family protein [Demequinaceae bacterium]
MSIPPPPPVERQSFYPEPHRVGEWVEPPPPRSARLVIILGFLAVALLLVGIIELGLSLGRARGTEDATVVNPDGATINAIQVTAGTCLAELPDDSAVSRVTAVPCNVPHKAEVVSSYRLAGNTWPGRESVEDRVLSHCGSLIQPGFDADSMFKTSDWEDGLRWVAWLPTERSWGMDERSGVCVVYRSGDMVGSFIAGTATFTD